MKKILFIAPHSFPIHSSESIANSKLAYALACRGYEVHVFSIIPNGDYPTSDLEVEMLRHPNLKIQSVSEFRYLTRSKPVYRQISVLLEYFFIYIKTGLYYNGLSLPYNLLKTIRHYIKSNEDNTVYDAVITRGFLTEYIGIELVKEFGFKWIANWNDPYPIEKFPAPYGSGADCKLPKSKEKLLDNIQKYAFIHTFPCIRLRDYMLRYFNNISEEKTCVVPHMANTRLSKPLSNTDSHVLQIVHAGNLLEPRNPNVFLTALNKLVKQGCSDIIVTFIGKLSSDFEERIADLDLSKNIRVYPSMSYFDVINFISTQHLSLVIEAVCDEGIYLPTKVVDSIQCSVPVFCVSPIIGTLNDLVQEYRIGYHANNASVADTYNSLFIAYTDFKNNRLRSINRSDVEFFYEESIIDQYSSII